MNYQRIYDALMASRKANKTPDSYHEKHHIIPRSMGGTDENSNLVELTGREHYLAHWLLARIHGGSQWVAVWFMSSGGCNSAKGARVTAGQYDAARKKYNSWAKSYFSENNPFSGKRHSAESLAKMRENNPYVSGQIKGELHHNYGKKFPESSVFISAFRSWSSDRVSVDFSLCNTIHKTVGFYCKRYVKHNRMVGQSRLYEKRSKSAELEKLRLYYTGLRLGAERSKSDISGEKNPNWGNDKVKGDGNGRHISAKWVWQHKYDPILLVCTAYEAYTDYGMSKSGVLDCINGNRIGTRKWVMIGPKDESDIEPERMSKIKARTDWHNAEAKCPHCGYIGRINSSNMKGKHFNNCKHKKQAA